MHSLYLKTPITESLTPVETGVNFCSMSSIRFDLLKEYASGVVDFKTSFKKCNPKMTFDTVGNRTLMQIFQQPKGHTVCFFHARQDVDMDGLEFRNMKCVTSGIVIDYEILEGFSIIDVHDEWYEITPYETYYDTPEELMI